VDNDNNLSKKELDDFFSLELFVCERFLEESRDSSFVLLSYLSTTSTTTFFRLFLIYCVTILFIFFHSFALSIDVLATFLGLLDLIVARRLCRIMLRVLAFSLSFSMQSAFFS